MLEIRIKDKDTGAILQQVEAEGFLASAIQNLDTGNCISMAWGKLSQFLAIDMANHLIDSCLHGALLKSKGEEK